MKPLRSGFSKWFGALFVALGGLFLAANVLAEPAAVPKAAKQGSKATTKPKSVRKAAPAARKQADSSVPPGAPVAHGAEPGARVADIYPGSDSAADDLELSGDPAKKAEAMATFARALLDEDSAETERATQGYLKTLALDPSFTKLAEQVALEMVKRGDVSGGIQVLKDAVKASPKEPKPLIYLSQLYWKQLKKPELALKYAEQAVALAPDDFQPHHTLFELHVASGQPKKAEEALDRAAKSKTTDPKYWVQLGDLYTRLFLKEDGSAAPEPMERMNAIYRKAAENAKNNASILAKVGDYFVLSRQVAEAVPYYLNALAKRSSDEDPAVANLREKLARAFLVTEKKDEAVAMLEALAKENPLRFQTYEMLGELYEQKGEIEKAMHNYEQSLLIDSSQIENYQRVAEMCLKLKRPDRAVQTMRSARSKFPDQPRIAFSLAVTLSEAKKHTEAMTVFAEAQAEAEQGHEEMLNSQFYFMYGAAAERAGLMEKAAELLRESIRLDPADAAKAYNYMGYMWVDKDMRLDEAGELIKKALELDADNGAYIDSLGWFYYKKGDYDRALKELQRALENLKEEDAVIFEHIADTYLKLGKSADALNYWQKSMVLEANPKVQEKIDAAKQQVTKSAPAPSQETK